MDLSNLSSNLPPTKSLESVSLLNLNSELTDEFKNAAKSVATLYNANSAKGETGNKAKTEFANAAKAVASLYRLSTNANELLMHKGYLNCLDDLLRGIANSEDIENWALTKRAELTNYYNHKDVARDVTRDEAKVSLVPQSAGSDVTDFMLPSEYKFAFPSELTAHTAFHASFPPLSLSYKRNRNHIDLKHKKAQSLSTDSNPASSEAESEASDSSSDIELRKKRKATRAQQECAKKRKRDMTKRDSACDSS